MQVWGKVWWKGKAELGEENGGGRSRKREREGGGNVQAVCVCVVWATGR